MKKFKIFRKILALVLIGALLIPAAVSALPVKAEEAGVPGENSGETGNRYGIEIESVTEYGYYNKADGEVDTSRIVVTCPDEWKDKIRYQWRREILTPMGYYDMIDVEGETDSSFCPSLEMLKESSWFMCQVTVEGDNNFFLESDYVFYRKLDDCIDLTTTAYDDKIDADTSGVFTRKIQGSADTKSLHIRWEPVNRDSSISITDSMGRSFYNHDDEDSLEVDLEGNFCYISIYYNRQIPSAIGITEIKERDTFTKKPFRFEVGISSAEDTFHAGEVLDKTDLYAGLYFNDGTYEVVPADSFTFDTSQVLHYGENQFVIKDTKTGLSNTVIIRIRYSPEWKETPAGSFTAGEIQKASVQAPEGEEPLCFLWMLKDLHGELAMEIEDDTESEIILPQNILPGQYQLYCYYYTKKEGFREYDYIVTEFRVKASAQTPSPAPSKTPTVTQAPAPSASPLPTPKQKEPGKASASLMKKKNTVTVKIKRKASADGCQIVYAKNKALTKGKVSVSTKKLSYKIRGLKKRQKIYVRVRAYCLAGKKKRYGKWSSIVSAR